jgi:uncharacterized protein
MPNTIMHFEIPADDVSRAKTFYEKTFGWTIKAYPMPPGQEYFAVMAKQGAEEGINGGLMKRQNEGQSFTNYVTVKSIDAMSQAVQNNGGAILMPKQEIPGGMGWIAMFRDPEGNVMGLHQPGAAAAQPAARKSARPSARKRASTKGASKTRTTAKRRTRQAARGRRR